MVNIYLLLMSEFDVGPVIILHLVAIYPGPMASNIATGGGERSGLHRMLLKARLGMAYGSAS